MILLYLFVTGVIIGALISKSVQWKARFLAIFSMYKDDTQRIPDGEEYHRRTEAFKQLIYTGKLRQLERKAEQELKEKKQNRKEG